MPTGMKALVGCGPSSSEFQDADPTGYDACAAFGRAQGAGGETYSAEIRVASESGLAADSQAISDAVDDRNGGADGVT